MEHTSSSPLRPNHGSTEKVFGRLVLCKDCSVDLHLILPRILIIKDGSLLVHTLWWKRLGKSDARLQYLTQVGTCQRSRKPKKCRFVPLPCTIAVHPCCVAAGVPGGHFVFGRTSSSVQMSYAVVYCLCSCSWRVALLAACTCNAYPYAFQCTVTCCLAIGCTEIQKPLVMW